MAKNPIAISIAFGQKAVKFDSKNVAFESGLEIWKTIDSFELNKKENVLKRINLQLAILKMKLEVHALSIMKALIKFLFNQ